MNGMWDKEVETESSDSLEEEETTQTQPNTTAPEAEDIQEYKAGPWRSKRRKILVINSPKTEK
jgi:hypothetical protein